MPAGFRRFVFSAVAIIACLFIFTRIHSTPQHVASTSPSIAKAAGAAGEGLAGKPMADKGSTYERPPSKEQKPLAPGPNKPLVERLKFQYPYDPEGKFPAYIWQTWKVTPASGQFASKLRPMEASWTEKNPGFVHEVITDDTARHLVRYLYQSVPEVVEAYEAMPLPVLKADFFRYLILLARGGIYSDIDTEAIKSAIEWLPKDLSPSTVGLVVGIEADPDRPDWHDWYSRRIQFCQWTIQSKPGHPVLRDVVARITEDTLGRKRVGFGSHEELHKDIIEYTGPARWTDTIFDYMNNAEYFKMDPDGKNVTVNDFFNMRKAKKVGDVVVLPITSFSPDIGQMNAGTHEDPMAFVKHEFEGTWKSASEQVKPVLTITVYPSATPKAA